jgi:hypothetical protein
MDEVTRGGSAELLDDGSLEIEFAYTSATAVLRPSGRLRGGSSRGLLLSGQAAARIGRYRSGRPRQAGEELNLDATLASDRARSPHCPASEATSRDETEAMQAFTKRPRADAPVAPIPFVRQSL